MRKYASHFSSAALMAVLLAGCATTEASLHTREALRTTSELNSLAASPAAPANTASVQVTPTTYVGATASRNLNGDPLPSKWQSQNVSFVRASAADFQTLAGLITQTTGIPVAVSTAGAGGSQVAAQPVGTSDFAVPAGTDPNLAAALGSLSAASAAPVTAITAEGPSTFDGSMKLNYQGNLKGFLDLVAATFNVHWEYKENRILFSRTVTRVFDVPALPIVAQLSFTMRSSAGGSGDGTQAGQSASTEGGFDLWADLNEAMEGIVGDTGAFRMSEQTGQVIVVAPPSTMSRAADYLRQLNAQLNKQVAIAVKVYSVTIEDGDDYNSDVSVLFRDAGRFGLSLVGNGPVAGASGLGWAVLDGNSAYSGSEGVVRALSSRGDVSTVTSASVTALNGVPVPVQVANTQAYAASVTTTTNPQTGQVTGGTVTPGEVTTGFNLHLVPKILGNGALLLQYGVNISELVELANFGVPGGGNIQLPNVNQRNFIQQAQIPNGATLVLAGFEQTRASSRSNGPLHSGLWGLGGGRQSTMRREVMVIAITPTVLDISPAAQAAYAQ